MYPPRPGVEATSAGGTHPTSMLSCFSKINTMGYFPVGTAPGIFNIDATLNLVYPKCLLGTMPWPMLRINKSSQIPTVTLSLPGSSICTECPRMGFGSLLKEMLLPLLTLNKFSKICNIFKYFKNL